MIEPHLLLQPIEAQIERQRQTEHLMILLQDPLLAAAHGLLQLVLQLAEPQIVLAAQLEAVAVQHLSGLGRVGDEGVRLAGVKME
ncbi:hypothetical protein D3C78_1554950 [compost metagenome]